MGIQDFRDILMIAGKDPYAWKGVVTDAHSIYVRPSGEGGCDSGAKKTEAKGEMGGAAKSSEMGGSQMGANATSGSGAMGASSGQMGGSQMGASQKSGGGQMGG